MMTLAANASAAVAVLQLPMSSTVLSQKSRNAVVAAREPEFAPQLARIAVDQMLAAIASFNQTHLNVSAAAVELQPPMHSTVPSQRSRNAVVAARELEPVPPPVRIAVDQVLAAIKRRHLAVVAAVVAAAAGRQERMPRLAC